MVKDVTPQVQLFLGFAGIVVPEHVTDFEPRQEWQMFESCVSTRREQQIVTQNRVPSQ